MSIHCHQYLGWFHQNNWISSEFRGQPQACKKMLSLPMNDLSFSLPRNFFRRTGDSQGGAENPRDEFGKSQALPYFRESETHGASGSWNPSTRIELLEAGSYKDSTTHAIGLPEWVRKAIDSKGRWCCSCYVLAMMGACSLWIWIKPKWSLG